MNKKELDDLDYILNTVNEKNLTEYESVLKKNIRKLELELEQQRFNNKHNLSIDQTIADRIESLQATANYATDTNLKLGNSYQELKIQADLLFNALNNAEVHVSIITYDRVYRMCRAALISYEQFKEKDEV